MRNLSILALVLLGFGACRDTNSGGDDEPQPDAAGTDTTIQQVQNDAMAPGSPVELKGVIVTAIDAYGNKTGDFWVQEPEGGPYSGVHVFGGPVDQIATLAIGDVVDIKGAVKDEYTPQNSSGSITELKPAMTGSMQIVKTGSGAAPAPQVVDALAIGQKADWMARAAEWEKWEGVLITVNNVTAYGAPQEIPSTNNPDPTRQQFPITGDAAVESSIAAFPTGIAYDSCLGSVTGVVDFFYDYVILPRTTADVVTGGSACPPKEATPALCTDGLDNDGNGYSDCSDNACAVAEASCRTMTTISAIQTATTLPTGVVEIPGVYVAALQRASGTFKPRHMWVQTNPAAAPNEGLFIYGPSGTDLSAYPAGSKVNVIGKVTEFNDSQMMGTGTLTEITLLGVSAATGTGTIAPVTGQSVATLSVDATGEPYESVLVQLANVKITTVADSMYHVGSMKADGVTFKYDDDAYRIPEGATGDPVNTCYATINGFWSYHVYDNAWYFLPTGPGNKTGGNCPP